MRRYSVCLNSNDDMRLFHYFVAFVCLHIVLWTEAITLMYNVGFCDNNGRFTDCLRMCFVGCDDVHVSRTWRKMRERHCDTKKRHRWDTVAWVASGLPKNCICPMENFPSKPKLFCFAFNNLFKFRLNAVINERHFHIINRINLMVIRFLNLSRPF